MMTPVLAAGVRAGGEVARWGHEWTGRRPQDQHPGPRTTPVQGQRRPHHHVHGQVSLILIAGV